MKNLSFLILLLLGFTQISHSQSLESVDWGAFKELPEGTSYQQAVGFDADAYYFVRTNHKVRLNRLQLRLDAYSSLTNTQEASNEILLPSIGGVQTQYEALFYRENKFVLFSSAKDKNRKLIVLYVAYLNADGSVKNKAKEIASIPLSNASKDGFDIFLSKDEKTIFIEYHKTFKKYNADKFNILALDFNLKERFKTEFTLDAKYNNRELLIKQKSYNEDKFIFLAKVEDLNSKKSAKSKSYKFVVFGYNTTKKSVFDFPVNLAKFVVADAKYTVNKQGNIVVGGFMRGRSEKFANEKQGMFFKRYNPNTLKAIPDLDLKSAILKFPREFLPEIQKPEYGENKSFQYAYSVNSVEELDNGGYIILAEQKWEDGRVVIDPRTKEETGIAYYYYNNIMAGGIDKKGKFSWVKIYPKKQSTTNDNGYYSSYKVIVVKNKLKIFYNDNEKNLHAGELKKLKEFTNNVRTQPKGKAGVYSIYWDGSYERDPMFSGKDNNVVLIPSTLAPNSVEYSVGVTNGKEVKFASFTLE